MSKKAIAWIVGLMSLSLIGLIAFQVYWIQLSMQQKAEEFDRDVLQALELTKEKIEKEEAKAFLSKLGKNDSDSIEVNLEWKQDQKFEVVTNHTVKVGDKDQMVESVSQRLEFLKDTNFKGSVMLISEDIEGVNLSSTTEGKSQKVKLIKRFQQRKNKLSEAVEELAFEFAFKESSLSERLKNINVDSLLKSAFTAFGLESLNYQYSLVNSATDSLLAGDYLKSQKVDQYFYQRIFDSPQESGILSFIVENKTAFILESLWVLVSISILLTLIMIGTFGFTIYAILRQKKISSIKSDFINNMTHEFKTPIATISLAVDSIFHPKVKGKEQELERFAKIIKNENERMNLQVEQVLQAAQFEKGEIQLKSENVEVDKLLQEVVENFSLEAKSEASELSLKLEAQNHLLKTDKMHLYNCLSNLIDNAIKYSKDPFQVKVKTYNQEQNLIIEVIDQGIGMDAETQKRAFDRFYRRQSGNLHDSKGFGLGLSYVQSIMEQMGGSVNLKSKVGKGSTFSLRIPLTDD
ncbi:MAG: HAMP domain-containing sensor histidine kinase [Vicingaceae bacterium]